MPDRAAALRRTLRPRPRPGPPVSGCPARRDLPGLEDVRRCPAAARSRRARQSLYGRARLRRVQLATLRGAELRAAAAGRAGLPRRHGPHDGRSHPGALGRAHPPARHGGPALVVDPVAAAVRRPGRPLPGGLLLGFVLHDARAGRERPDRSGAQHARQLRVPDQDRRAHPQWQPDVLSQPQPAAVLRRDDRAVRHGDRHHAGAGLPRCARG